MIEENFDNSNYIAEEGKYIVPAYDLPAGLIINNIQMFIDEKPGEIKHTIVIVTDQKLTPKQAVTALQIGIPLLSI